MDNWSHSHCSHLIELGFPPVAIAERLGHEKVETTQNTYSHLYPNKQNEIATKLDQRVKVTGEVKGDYLRAMALVGEINISVGKYQSDKLAMELKKLSDRLEKAIEKNYEKDIYENVTEIKFCLKSYIN